MIHLKRKGYAYLEEVNDGVLKQLPRSTGDDRARVLDVGCGGGALGEAIQERGYEVWGIEQNPGAAATARTRIHRVIEADLTDGSRIQREVGDTRFDWLVFSDVLEHVYDPLSILEQYSGVLAPGGRVVISVPNAVVWTNRLAFLLGRFEYADTGVMDRTHIRFFTFSTAKRVLRAAQLSVTRVDYTPFAVRALLPLIKRLLVKPSAAPDRRQLIDSPLYRFYARWIYPLEYYLLCWWKSLFAFRIILIGSKT